MSDPVAVDLFVEDRAQERFGTVVQNLAGMETHAQPD